jgi:hypothetical protein
LDQDWNSIGVSVSDGYVQSRIAIFADTVRIGTLCNKSLTKGRNKLKKERPIKARVGGFAGTGAIELRDIALGRMRKMR